MKKVMYCVSVFTMVLFSLMATGCDSGDDIIDDNGDNSDENVIEEGPSFDDDMTIPGDASFLGDSIRYMKTFPLSEYNIQEVLVSTTQNGHISVLGGYKDQSAIYVYAKTDDDRGGLNDEQIKAILDKYYSVEYYANHAKIVADIREKEGIIHEADFHSLRISVKVFAPQNVSTALNIGRGSIFVNNVHGNQHRATSVSGAIKYIHSSGNDITVNSESGHIGLINIKASRSINSKLSKGNILIALPKDTKAKLYLESSTKVNAYILNGSNFQGTSTRNKVDGVLNGGGFEMNANSGLGVINLKWYEGNDYDY